MKIDKMKFQNLSAFMVAYSLIVILWGAFVRISNSGDGCGKSWPLCHNTIIPFNKTLPTWIEFGHRLTSGLYGIIVLVLVILAFRLFEKGHIMRKLAVATGILTISEALLGARLVLAGLVGANDSIERALTMTVHLVNSLLLVASLVLQYDWSKEVKYQIKKMSKKTQYMNIFLVVLFILVACSGGIAALSTTLFPAESLLSGVLADFSHESHYLVRIRISHPLVATFFGIILVALTYSIYLKTKDDCLKFRTTNLMGLIASGIGLGYATLFMLSPLFLKLLHLTWAYLIWTAIILCVSRGIQLASIKSDSKTTYPEPELQGTPTYSN